MIDFLFDLLARFISWELSLIDGVRIIHKDDAAIIFREGSTGAEVYFPIHLRPEDDSPENPHEAPPYIASAALLIFAMQKEWVMDFLADYMNDPQRIEDDMATAAVASELADHLMDHIDEMAAEAAEGEGNGKMDMGSDSDETLH